MAPRTFSNLGAVGVGSAVFHGFQGRQSEVLL
jgi:hypothetical protein